MDSIDRTFSSLGVANAILAAFAEHDRTLLLPHLTRVRLEQGVVLAQSGEPLDAVHFIEAGLVSLVADDEPGGGVHLALIGRDGAAGLHEMLCGSGVALAGAVVQTAGWALRAPMTVVMGASAAAPGVRAGCAAWVQDLVVQALRISASHARHSVLQRCARWLLLAQDRLHAAEVIVTHEALATALGVRRSGVTVATATLQGQGLIRTGRGRIRILNRAGLETAARG